MRIGIGSDHAGYALKEAVKAFLPDLGAEVVDYGTGGESSVDYPDFAFAVADAVGSAHCDRGILVCKTGIGMSIAANKILGIRAALCHNAEAARLSRAHNDANVLVLGAQWVNEGEAREIVKAWLTTAFEGGRHLRRVEKIMNFERERSSGR
jgi:RpiB/LacA/LacB family sugar-phosphate isomerase